MLHLISSGPRSWLRRLAVSPIFLVAILPALAVPVNGSLFIGTGDTSKLIAVPQETLDAQLTDVSGKKLKLSDYAGKVVVVNLWATWCGPCRVEQPELDRMAKEYAERGVVFLGVTTVRNDGDLDLVKKYIRDNKLALRTIYDKESFAASLQQSVNARAVIPQSYVITKDKKILTHFEGFNARTTPATMRKMIDLALKLGE
jgi:thiol-disulfide isomerase/thioredoxin